MKQLNEIVEKIVDPIHASDKRKCKMRVELLSHLIEIYYEEQLKESDDNLVLQQTLQRFGDISSIQKDLQSSVPFWERYPIEKKSCLFFLIVFFISMLIRLLLHDTVYFKNNPFIYYDRENHEYLYYVYGWIICSCGLLSVYSRKWASNPSLNVRSQLACLALLNWLFWGVIRPVTFSTIVILINRGYPVAWFWFDFILLLNIPCMLWIAHSYKHNTIYAK